MEQQQINNLLDKYFEGETDLVEETKLRTYFANNKTLPPELEEYRILFSYFEAEQEKVYQGDVLLPQKRSYKWPIALSGIVAVVAALWLTQPFADEAAADNSSRNSGIATENARSLFMMMGSVPEESREKLGYLNELEVLKISELSSEEKGASNLEQEEKSNEK
ncbi:MAG TPA: hypothetical protein VK021_13490 [Flavobacteriaceae bacterium]|nr:hypothetical protein [Flavobacteriaceae bacterium]